MERISKSGKDFEDTLNAILEENNLTKEDVIYTTGEVKKGLFKGETTEVIVYKKEEIYSFAKEFLKEVINNLGLEVSFEIKKQDDRVVIKMYSNNNNILIGHNGNTLRALETLLKQKIQVETGIHFSISLDVENYKDKKVARIERLAKQTAKEVARTKVDAHLENMNAYERRIVHNILTNFKGVSTKSEGEEPNRHVVISSTKE
ncbi:MAG: KH domain-containing protein [Firmicutes bacterium]|nr:KH domain-containing protein [Bacillota bacterium]